VCGAPEGAQHHDQTAAIPRLGHLGPPFDMHSRRSARPACARFFTGGDAPHVAYRLLQQIRATNTPVELPDLDLGGGDNRSLTGATASPIERSDSLARAGPTGCSQPRGCALPIRNTRRKRPLAPTDLPRPDEPGHLLSQICTPSKPGEPHGVTVAVTAPPKRTNLPDAPHLRVDCL